MVHQVQVILQVQQVHQELQHLQVYPVQVVVQQQQDLQVLRVQ